MAKALSGQLDEAIGERVAAGIEQTLLQNGGGVEFWQQYCPLAAPVLPEAGRTGKAITALRQAAQALLQIKGGAPLDVVAPDESFTQALAGFEMLRASLEAYNAAVAAANAVIEARQRETQAANARDVETALAKLRAQKVRHTDEVRELCAADERLQGEKIALENEKAQARELLGRAYAAGHHPVRPKHQPLSGEDKRWLQNHDAHAQLPGWEAKHELSNCHQSKRRRSWGCGDAGRQTEF